jgi:hypothetical protein
MPDPAAETRSGGEGMGGEGWLHGAGGFWDVSGVRESAGEGTPSTR